MSVNAGGVHFDVVIGRVVESIANTRKLTASLVKQDEAIKQSVAGYDKQRVAGAKVLAANKRLATFNKTMLKGIYDIRKASRAMASSTVKQASALKSLHRVRIGYNATIRKTSGFKEFSKQATYTKRARVEFDKLHASALRMNRAWKTNTASRMSRDMRQLLIVVTALSRHLMTAGNATQQFVAKSRTIPASSGRASRSINTQATMWYRLKAAMTGAGAGYHTWWKRFGVIAIGFAVAYRAIYAFQLGVSSLTRAFFGGLTVMDDYKEGLATIAGMIALTYESSGTYSDRFVAAHNLMAKSMENAMRLAPKYRMSMEEITAGFRELAQFGVVVTPQETERTLNTLATIKEISLSSGSTTKQIRQEVQALFQGQARVTDQFTRMIKITMPELYRTLQDGALSTTKKWKLLTEEMWDFNQAVRASNQTVKNQALIAKGTLQIISKMAVEHSGVFGRWVKSIRDFNERLFDVEGNLLPFGRKIEEVFADIWTSVDYSVKAIIDLGRVIKEAWVATKQFLEPWKDIVKITLKTVVTMFVLRTVMQMTVGLATTLLGITGLGGLVKILTMDISSMSFVLGLKALNKTLGALLLKMLLIPAAFAGAFALGPMLATELEAMDTYITTLLVETLKNITSTVSFAMMNLLESIASMPFKAAMAWWKSFTTQTNDLDASNKIMVDKLNEALDDIIKKGAEAGKSTAEAFADAREKAAKASDLTRVKNDAIYKDENLVGTLGWVKSKLLSWKDDLGELLKFDFTELIGLDGTKLGNAIASLMENASKIAGDGLNNLNTQYNPVKYGGADRTKPGDIGRPKSENQIDYKKMIVGLDRDQLGITNSLAKLTTKASLLEIDKTVALANQLALKKELLASNKLELDYVRESNDDGEASASFNKQLKVVKKLQREVDLLAKAYAKVNEQPWQAFSNGIAEWSRGVDTVGQKFNALGKEIIPSIASSWSSVWQGVFSGEITNFGDLFDGVMGGIQDSFAKAMTNMVDIYVEQFLNEMIKANASSGLGEILGSLFGSMFGGVTTSNISLGGAGSGSMTAASGGGYVPSAVAGFASGGIIPEHVWGVGASGQQYEFGENGPERVLSNSDSFAQPQVNVSVNLVNNSKAQVTEQTQSRFDGKKMVLDIVLEDYTNGGATYRAFGR
jgi:hypothetical protein